MRHVHLLSLPHDTELWQGSHAYYGVSRCYHVRAHWCSNIYSPDHGELFSAIRNFESKLRRAKQQIVLLVTKAVGDFLGVNGIADEMIRFNGYPFLEKEDHAFHTTGTTAVEMLLS